MVKTAKIKRLEKLQAKIIEIDERVKNDLEQKQQYIKEIETLEAESILDACRSSNLGFEEAVESFALFSKMKENGYSAEDMTKLIVPKNPEDEPNDETESEANDKAVSEADGERKDVGEDDSNVKL